MTPAPSPTFQRVVLVLTALAFAGIGVGFLLLPARMAARLDLSLETSLAANDVRAVYGGLQIGLGVFFLLASARPSWHRTALGVLVAAFAGLAGGRFVSLALDGWAGGFAALLHGAELLGLACGLWALRRVEGD